MNLADITHPDPRVQRACRRYASALVRHSGMRRGDGNLKEQLGRYLQATERHQVLVRRVREVLEDYDIPMSLGQPYRNFAARVLRVMGKFELRTRHILILEAVDRALAYGCDRQILKRICREVCGYDFEERGRALNCEE